MAETSALSEHDLQPLRRVPLKEQAYERIKQRILRGTLPGGTVLSESALADTLGISRTPVREALMQLAAEGLVDYSPFNGSRVHSMTAVEREEIFVLRRTLELLAVRRLAAAATPEQLDALEAILDLQAQYGAETRQAEFMAADAEFHRTLAEFAGLNVTQKFLGHIRSMFHLMGLEAISVPGRSSAVVAEHRQIVQALRERDAEAAERAITTHLGVTEHLIEAAHGLDQRS
jgi:DNA-binding GntR family transcriptional regulator